MFAPYRIRAHRRRAAGDWAEYDFLKARLSSDLIERLEDTPRQFDRVLDLGSHGGTLARKLAQHRQIGQVLATDPLTVNFGLTRTFGKPYTCYGCATSAGSTKRFCFFCHD
ncbi:MAG: class I SAM-dependent methyltransferase [Pseudomonadota bacterium]